MAVQKRHRPSRRATRRPCTNDPDVVRILRARTARSTNWRCDAPHSAEIPIRTPAARAQSRSWARANRCNLQASRFGARARRAARRAPAPGPDRLSHRRRSAKRRRSSGAPSRCASSDWIFPCYREFGAALWRGMPLDRVREQHVRQRERPRQGPADAGPLRRKRSRASRRSARRSGRRSPRRPASRGRAKIKKDDVAALVYFGEGATSSGEFHNGMNFAGVFKAPVVFFCRNNGWADQRPGRAADRERVVRGRRASRTACPGVRVRRQRSLRGHQGDARSASRARRAARARR